MKFPVDIHTHRLPPVPGMAIANRYPDTFAPEEGGVVFGRHTSLAYPGNRYSGCSE